MSHQAQTWVIRHSRHKGSNLFLLYLIANHAWPDGTHAEAGEKTLARECRMSERQVRRIITEKLLPSGELAALPDAGKYGTTRYVLPGLALDGPVPLPEPDKMSAPLKDKMSAPREDKMSGSEKIPDKMSSPLKDISAPSCGHPPGAHALCAGAEPRNPREFKRRDQGIKRASEKSPPHAPARESFSPSSSKLSDDELARHAAQVPCTPEELRGIVPQWADRRIADGRPSANWEADLRAFARDYLKREARDRAAPARASPSGAGRSRPVTFAEQRMQNSQESIEKVLAARRGFERGRGELSAGDDVAGGSVPPRLRAHTPGDGGLA